MVPRIVRPAPRVGFCIRSDSGPKSNIWWWTPGVTGGSCPTLPRGTRIFKPGSNVAWGGHGRGALQEAKGDGERGEDGIQFPDSAFLVCKLTLVLFKAGVLAAFSYCLRDQDKKSQS